MYPIETGKRSTLSRTHSLVAVLGWLKVAARVRITARKVWVSFSSAYPYREEFAAIAEALRAEPARAPSA